MADAQRCQTCRHYWRAAPAQQHAAAELFPCQVLLSSRALGVTRMPIRLRALGIVNTPIAARPHVCAWVLPNWICDCWEAC